jgi:uncharacterized protein YxjI
MYDDDIKAVQAEVRPSVGLEFSEDSEDAKSMTINKLYQKAEQTFKEQYKINYVFLNNYGKADGHVVFRVDDGVTLTGDGVLALRSVDGEELIKINQMKRAIKRQFIIC